MWGGLQDAANLFHSYQIKVECMLDLQGILISLLLSYNCSGFEAYMGVKINSCCFSCQALDKNSNGIFKVSGFYALLELVTETKTT